MLRDELINFLRENVLRLDTGAGQHFLVDQEVLDDIIATAEISSNDLIIEIGPGIGILTRELLQAGARVRAVEIDLRFPPMLEKFVRTRVDTITVKKNLTIIRGNALQEQMPNEAYSVVANIPYHITSPLLHHLFLEGPVPNRITLLVQREVAENICREGDDGLLTILVELFGTATFIRSVSPQAFVPPPKVDSAVLSIIPYETPLLTQQEAQEVLKLCRHAFSKKRKMLRNSFASLPWGLETLEKANIDSTRRPQDLSAKEWIDVTRIHKTLTA